jgi:hypothetical protein
MTKLPTPEQWIIHEMNEMEMAEEIEKHIDYVDEEGRSVHLPMQFVRHFLTRHDDDLPIIVAIATLPIILADGGILAYEDDIDELRGIDFVIPKEVMALLPRREDCTPEAVKKAMQFLTDEWLCDVKAGYAGKASLIAAALSIIERSLLPNRPAFFVTAGRRGSGKTTALIMLIMAVTGIHPAAAAWSSNEEERRKALLSYFLYGVSYILWDNIPRGAQISCPHIEKSCTASYYADRRLGVSEMVATAASAIHFFTGNNVSPRGDLASRSLMVRLDVDRPDPENREFKHPDPITWTEDNRAEILQAFYVILLGNPKLDEPRNAPMKTRFKIWWRLVGSAVENAAKQVDETVDFEKLFLNQDEDSEDDVSLAEVLTTILDSWPGPPPTKKGDVCGSATFKASDICGAINSQTHKAQETLREFFCPTLPDGAKASSVTVGKVLKGHVDEPVYVGKPKPAGGEGEGRWTLTLKAIKDPSAGKAPLSYKINKIVED